MQPPSNPGTTLAVQLVRGPGAVVYLALIAVFGFLVPWQKGLDFLDPVILIAYACLGSVFAGPAVVQLFNTLPGSATEAFKRVAAGVVFGEILVVILLGLGLTTVRLMHRGIFPFDAGSALAGLVLGATLSLALSAMAAWIRLTRSATAARGALRVALVAMLLGFVLRSRSLPDIAWTAAGISLAVAVVFLVLLAKGARA